MTVAINEINLFFPSFYTRQSSQPTHWIYWWAHDSCTFEKIFCHILAAHYLWRYNYSWVTPAGIRRYKKNTMSNISSVLGSIRFIQRRSFRYKKFMAQISLCTNIPHSHFFGFFFYLFSLLHIFIVCCCDALKHYCLIVKRERKMFQLATLRHLRRINHLWR